MPKKDGKSHGKSKPATVETASAADEFDTEFPSEFRAFSKQLEANIGVVVARALRGGGYFGMSLTDDGTSVKLVIRNGDFAFDKRLVSTTQLEAGLAFCLRKLRERQPGDSDTSFLAAN